MHVSVAIGFYGADAAQRLVFAAICAGDTGNSIFDANCSSRVRCYMCMAMYGNVWQCMPMYGNVWKCMDMYGNVWKCMEMYGNVWKCAKAYKEMY